MNSKKIMFFSLFLGYLFFGLVMGWTVFGSVYPMTINTDPIFLFCKTFTLISFTASIFLWFFTKNLNNVKMKAFVFIALPYFICQILYVFFEWYIPIQKYDSILLRLLDPYLIVFVWMLSLFMLFSDWTLNKLVIFYKNKKTI